MTRIDIPLLAAFGAVAMAASGYNDYKLGNLLAQKVTVAGCAYTALNCDAVLASASSELADTACYCKRLSSLIDLVKPHQTYYSVAPTLWFTAAAVLGVTAAVGIINYCRKGDEIPKEVHKAHQRAHQD